MISIRLKTKINILYQIIQQSGEISSNIYNAAIKPKSAKPKASDIISITSDKNYNNNNNNIVNGNLTMSRFEKIPGFENKMNEVGLEEKEEIFKFLLSIDISTVMQIFYVINSDQFFSKIKSKVAINVIRNYIYNVFLLMQNSLDENISDNIININQLNAGLVVASNMNNTPFINLSKNVIYKYNNASEKESLKDKEKDVTNIEVSKNITLNNQYATNLRKTVTTSNNVNMPINKTKQTKTLQSSSIHPFNNNNYHSFNIKYNSNSSNNPRQMTENNNINSANNNATIHNNLHLNNVNLNINNNNVDNNNRKSGSSDNNQFILPAPDIEIKNECEMFLFLSELLNICELEATEIYELFKFNQNFSLNENSILIIIYLVSAYESFNLEEFFQLFSEDIFDFISGEQKIISFNRMKDIGRMLGFNELLLTKSARELQLNNNSLVDFSKFKTFYVELAKKYDLQGSNKGVINTANVQSKKKASRLGKDCFSKACNIL